MSKSAVSISTETENPAKVKPFKTYSEQIAILRGRGLLIANEAQAIEILKRMNYYRLSAYSLTLRQDDHFYPNVSIEDILTLYDFDAEFRKIILHYCSMAEISARAYISYYHAKEHGPLGYQDVQFFENAPRHAAFINKLSTSLEKSTETFVIHHKVNKNGVYPIWVAIEETTFGMLSLFYKNMNATDRTAIAKEFYGLQRKYIENSFQCAVVARNIAAHGSRFYNRINLKPEVLLPTRMRTISNNRPFAYVFAIFTILPDDEKLNFIQDIDRLFRKYPFALPRHLGFPTNWENILLDRSNIAPPK